MEDLKFYVNTCTDIFVKYFNKIDVENRYIIENITNDQVDKEYFNRLEITDNKSAERRQIFLDIVDSIEEEYTVEGSTEKEYKIKMLIRLTRANINLKKTYYFKTYSVRYDWGRTLFQLVSQVTAEMIRNLLGWDIWTC